MTTQVSSGMNPMSSDMEAGQFEDPLTDKEPAPGDQATASLQEESTIKLVKGGTGKSNLVHLNPGLKSTQRKVKPRGKPVLFLSKRASIIVIT